MSKCDPPELHELLLSLLVSIFAKLESEDDRVDPRSRVKARSPHISDDLDLLTGLFHTERDIGVVWLFCSSFEDLFSDFFLHHDHHFSRRFEYWNVGIFDRRV
jgi:hypothetical protein